MTLAPQPTSSQYRVLNPATGEIVEEYTAASDQDIHDAIAAADAAYASWKKRPMEERAKIVARAGEIFSERADELAAIITQEMGKPLSQAKGEAEFCTDIFHYYATEGPKLAADQKLEAEGGSAVIQRLPLGPLLGIMPWNYPYYQVARFVAPNLVLGNTIILKHAQNCPKAALAIADVLREAGVPEGVYTNVFATHDHVGEIIADPRIQGVSLTGSERAGTIVGQLAGQHLKKAVLELGGSDPYVILDTGDVIGAAAQAWETRMENTGQACNSNKRLIVMDDLFEDFVAALVEHATGLKPGDPAEEAEGTYAPLVSRAAAEDLNDQVQDAVTKGATLHVGGELQEGPGAYYSPAVLTGVTPEMRAFGEELFGPVLVVYKVSSDEEALELANNTRFGLGGAVFSADAERARRLAQELEVGMANVNIPMAEGANLPFGGVKGSGFGRELGPLGMDEFVNKRFFFVAG